MASRAALVVQVDLLIERAQALGLTIEAVEITTEGAVRVLTQRPLPGVALNANDDWVTLAGQTKDLGRA
jgi:predicted metal-dependent TIM-barrel fold hydrolase